MEEDRFDCNKLLPLSLTWSTDLISCVYLHLICFYCTIPRQKKVLLVSAGLPTLVHIHLLQLRHLIASTNTSSTTSA